MKCIDVLIAEHKVIRLVLEILRAMAVRAEDSGELDRQDAEAAVRFLREFADDYHQMREESVLFPAMARAGMANPMPCRAVCTMIFEHNQERSLVEGIEEGVLTANRTEFAAYVYRLIEILTTHIYKEENILFNLAGEILTTVDDDRLMQDLEAIDSATGDVSARFAASIRELEWKYLRKGAATFCAG